MTATIRTAEYKGRKYILLFLGSTKYGRRARLQFLDGKKDFWVDAALVRETTEDTALANEARQRQAQQDYLNARPNDWRARASFFDCKKPWEEVWEAIAAFATPAQKQAWNNLAMTQRESVLDDLKRDLITLRMWERAKHEAKYDAIDKLFTGEIDAQAAKGILLARF